MNLDRVRAYLSEYLKDFDNIRNQEIYKWKAVKNFQDHWDLNSSDFPSMLDESLHRVQNLMSSGQYYPKKMILLNAKKSPDNVKELFQKLFYEDHYFIDRINSFHKAIKKLNETNFPNLNAYQDHRAIVVYLSLRFPENYYFYKYEMFKKFCTAIDYKYTPKKGQLENISHYQNACNLVKQEITNNQELLKKHKNRLTDSCYYDSNFNILTQDFIYALTNYLSLSPTSKPSNRNFVSPKVEVIRTEDVVLEKKETQLKGRITNHIQKNISNKRIGDLGELWVKEFEENKLKQIGKENLAKRIKHISVDEGDGTGYDMKSFDEQGNEIFIEIKTTSSNFDQPFFITNNELLKSKECKKNYYLYRVYNYNEDLSKVKLKIFKGELIYLCKNPVNYEVKLPNKVNS